jgi:hypothetical protein
MEEVKPRQSCSTSKEEGNHVYYVSCHFKVFPFAHRIVTIFSLSLCKKNIKLCTHNNSIKEILNYMCHMVHHLADQHSAHVCINVFTLPTVNIRFP